VRASAFFAGVPLVFGSAVTVRAMARAIAVIRGVSMRSNGWTIMWFHRFNINFRQPVISATIVSIERERLEFFEHPAKTLSSGTFVVRESEFISSDWLDMVELVMSGTKSVVHFSVDSRLLREALDGSTCEIELPLSGPFDTHLFTQ
jgi:hypothetical protein